MELSTRTLTEGIFSENMCKPAWMLSIAYMIGEKDGFLFLLIFTLYNFLKESNEFFQN